MHVRPGRPITGLTMLYTEDVPAIPPPEVLAEVDAAWERASAPLEGVYGLVFEVDAGRVRGELRLPDGRVSERLTASQALLLACGDARARPPAVAA
jgi:hypothetical protein